MLIDLKYHIASLIAVFLALGFGILVGTTLLPNTLLLEKQNAIVKKLEKDFQEIKEENKKIKNKIRIAQSFEKAVFPMLVKNRIKGLKIDILEISEKEDFRLINSISDALKISGAEIKSITFIKENFGFEEIEVRKRICGHLGLDSGKKERAILNISLRLAREIREGKNTPLLKYLKKEDIIYAKGNYEEPSKFLVIITKERKIPILENILSPFIDIFEEKNVKIVGCETSDVVNSNIPFYKNKDISTVDNVETIYGKISLIYILSGKKGNFGIKNTASSLIPEEE
jgi:hypothetical protein